MSNQPESLDRDRLRAIGSRSWEAHWRQIVSVKVIGVLVADVCAMLFVRDVELRERFILITGGVYLPLSVVLYLIQRPRPTPPNGVWLAITAADVAMVGAAQAMFPGLSVAFLGLTAIVMVSAVLIGARWAMVVAGFSWVSLWVAIQFGEAGQPSAFSAVMAGLLLAGMAFLIGTLSDSERRTAARSRRLAQTIASVGSSLDLAEALEGLCDAARDSLGAAFCLVMLKDEDRLSLGAWSGSAVASSRAAALLEGSLRDPNLRTSATVRAVRDLVCVSIPDVFQDEALKPLHDIASEMGVRSVMSVPVHRHGASMGVLNAYLPRTHAFTADELEFMAALAEHAGIAIERARLFAKEREAVERLLDLDRMKSEFVATVSHELRTPLTAIEGFALTLRTGWKGYSEDLREELLERLRDNALSLDHLITHLLDFGRLERGEFQIQPGTHTMNELVDRVLGNMVHELASHQVVADVEPGLRVNVDRYAFDRILGNLLSNAAKFSAPGTSIEVLAYRHGTEVAISVRDHGRGIEPGDLSRIFDRFYRGAGLARGTGIGLAVVKDLVALHGGRVEVANALPGAVFTVHLAAAAAPARALA